MTICINPDDTGPIGTAQRIDTTAPFASRVFFVVPDGEQWEVLGGFFQYHAGDVAGDRKLQFEITDADGLRVWSSVIDGVVTRQQTPSIELARPDLYVAPLPPLFQSLLLALPQDTMVGAAWQLAFRDIFATSVLDTWSGGIWVRVLGGAIAPPPPLGSWCEPFIPTDGDTADALYTEHLERMNALSIAF